MRYKFTEEQLERMEKHKWFTDREKKIFNLFYKRGWDIERIAVTLRISRSCVNSTLYSIREKTKEEQKKK